MMKKTILFLVLCISLVNLVSSLTFVNYTFENQTIIIESVSNTTIRLEQNTTADKWDINSTEKAILIYNLSTQTTEFKNINTSFSGYINFKEINNGFFTNGSNVCNGSSTNINSNDAILNLTIPANESCTAFPDFNLTLGSLRTNSPLNIVEVADGEYHITNTLNDKIDGVLVQIPFSCSRIDRVQYVSDAGTTDTNPTYTCQNDLITIQSLDGIDANSLNSNVIYVREVTGTTTPPSTGGATTGGDDEDDLVVANQTTSDTNQTTNETVQDLIEEEQQEKKINTLTIFLWIGGGVLVVVLIVIIFLIIDLSLKKSSK